MKNVKFTKNGYETVMSDELAEMYSIKERNDGGKMVPKIEILGDTKPAVKVQTTKKGK